MSEKSSRAAALLFREQEKRRATADYVRRREAEHEKTQRLRALRLAREAADCAAHDEAMAAKTAPKTPRTRHRQAGADDQQFNKPEDANLSGGGLKHE